MNILHQQQQQQQQQQQHKFFIKKIFISLKNYNV